MATRNHIGKTIYISAALPATNDAAGFEAVAWTKANGVQQLPQLGITHNMIDIPDLQTGFTKTGKGSGTGAESEVTFRRVAGDPGQALARAQADSPTGLTSIKIVTGSGVDQAPVTGDPVQYAQGVMSSYRENQANDTTYEGFTVRFRQNELTIDATEPV